MPSLTGRIGCFFLIAGVIVLGVYLASDYAHAPQINWLIVGLAAILVGYSLWRKGRAAQPKRRSARFRMLRGYVADEEEEDDAGEEDG